MKISQGKGMFIANTFSQELGNITAHLPFCTGSLMGKREWPIVGLDKKINDSC